jgi:hypothetical protein
VQATGEAECVIGPIDQHCVGGAGEVGCTTNADCVVVGGPCVTETRRCFLDPIVRIGMPGTTMSVLAATFCIPATSSPAVNSTAGLPGPGAILYGQTVTAEYCGDGIKNRPSEQCDGADATNCPGQCQAGCICPAATCGNNVVEIGEQCDGTSNAACNHANSCVAPGPANQCTCDPTFCGDGFTAGTEQCDPGGPGGSPPPSDAACPGQCSVTCQCPAPICGNGVIEGSEVCEFPAVNCGPLQACNVPLCTMCVP